MNTLNARRAFRNYHGTDDLISLRERAQKTGTKLPPICRLRFSIPLALTLFLAWWASL